MASHLMGPHELINKFNSWLKDTESYELYEDLVLSPNLANSIRGVNQLIQYIIINQLGEICPNAYITIRALLAQNYPKDVLWV